MLTLKNFILHLALAVSGLIATMPISAQSVSFDATITVPAGLPGAGGGGSAAYSQRPVIYAPDAAASAFKKGTGNTVLVKAGTKIEMSGVLCAPTTDQTVTLPTLVAGIDYRIVGAPSTCTYQAITYSDAIPSGGHVLGGFHHLIGSPATGLGSGGGWTPTLLEWSIWDLSFRGKCEPRGMTRVGNSGQWFDIYFLGDSSSADGISRNNDTILTGTNPPVIPADYGGNGTTKYSTFHWWNANEFLRQFGKRLPSYEESVLSAFGTNEGTGRGSHPVKTGFATANTPTHSDPNFTSKWGLIQSTGVMWTWTSTISYWPGPATSNSWGWEAYNTTDGRGKQILPNPSGQTAILHGGSSVYTNTGSPTGAVNVAGSRAMETIEKLSDISTNIAIRGVCDHR